MFRATADVARHFSGRGRLRGVLGALARRPAALVRVLLVAARLPVVEVSVSAGQAAALLSPDFAPIRPSRA